MLRKVGWTEALRGSFFRIFGIGCTPESKCKIDSHTFKDQTRIGLRGLVIFQNGINLEASGRLLRGNAKKSPGAKLFVYVVFSITDVDTYEGSLQVTVGDGSGTT